ncbi:predicted protein [Histoplasma capsulatum H143]|uniref:Uncharacterized protein n=1 Tax=Ajellomyces capsulatus (strain H143) TaxID=544712 RepID=C6HPG6_AJECH|nr:predicted protein [Histoplasma capsulatum H143]
MQVSKQAASREKLKQRGKGQDDERDRGCNTGAGLVRDTLEETRSGEGFEVGEVGEAADWCWLVQVGAAEVVLMFDAGDVVVVVETGMIDVARLPEVLHNPGLLWGGIM